MSMRTSSKARAARELFIVAIVFIAALFLTGLIETAWAQNAPFAGLRSPGASQGAAAGGIVGWLFAKQAEFYRQFSGLIRSAKADGSAVWSLLGVSFLYGVFHAAGPGHGKAVISSYVVANAETWIRGVVLSLASALLQALAAIVIVGRGRGPSQRARLDHERGRQRDRVRELRAHHHHWFAAALGEGAHPSRRAARGASSDQRGRRRRDVAARRS
jgi:hypothetical protein